MVSPDVCRIFDLVEVGGQELVSMEYIDGETPSGTLSQRGPLELGEAREIASQFLAGLEAIHRAGLVHRDVTRSGSGRCRTSRSPPNRRPYEELMAALRSQINLRVVPDAASASGYKLEVGPFPGWANPPEW